MESKLLTFTRAIIQFFGNEGSEMIVEFAVRWVIEDWDAVFAAFDFGERVSGVGRTDVEGVRVHVRW